MLRTLGHERSSRDDWEEPFRTRWVSLLRQAGQADDVAEANPLGRPPLPLSSVRLSRLRGREQV